MGGNPGLSRWHGRRDVELGQKKDFTAEAKCGILYPKAVKAGSRDIVLTNTLCEKGERYETNH